MERQESPYLHHAAENEEKRQARRDEHQQPTPDGVTNRSRQLPHTRKPEEG